MRVHLLDRDSMHVFMLLILEVICDKNHFAYDEFLTEFFVFLMLTLITVLIQCTIVYMY